MNAMRNTRLLQTAGLLLSLFVMLANIFNPPNGRTGAPFDGGTCASSGCHDDNNPLNLGGMVAISGVPATIQPNTTYSVTLKVTPTAGNPVSAGFQLVVVNGNNLNCGNLTPVNGETGTEFFNGGGNNREYIEHRNGKSFGVPPAPVSWNFNWTAPATAAGNNVKFYYIATICDGNQQKTNDLTVTRLESFNFAGAPPMMATISSSNNVSCFGGNSGSATVDASGGVPPYTYVWTGGQTTKTAANLTAGTYTATVTGSNGSGTATATAVITQPPALTLSVFVPAPSGIITCFQPTVNVTANAGGGTPAYSFQWSNGSSGNPATFTAPGAYTVTATDAKGCTKTAAFNIAGNTTPPIAVAGPSRTITCWDPSPTLNGTGSSLGPNFSYLWTTVNGNIVSGATTLMPVVNAAGTYQIRVTNSNNGCTNTASTITTTNLPPATVNTTGGHITCTTQSITLTTTTNAAQPTFAWTGPGGFSSSQQTPSVTIPGPFTVTVTNGENGCTNTATAVVTQNTIPPSAMATATPITCISPTGSIQVTTNAAQATYAWTGPGGYISTLPFDYDISMAGTYTVTVTNTANGCTSSATALSDTSKTLPYVSVATPPILHCNLHRIHLNSTASSQGANFIYAWTTQNGHIVSGENTLAPIVDAVGAYTLLVTNTVNGCTAAATATVTQAPPLIANISAITNVSCYSGTNGSATVYSNDTQQLSWSNGANTATVTNLIAGTYYVTATNAYGCTTTASASITQPAVLSANVSATGETAAGAHDGTATAAPTGGTMPYTYLWSNSQTTAAITGLAPGTYTVTVTDNNACTALQIFTVNTFNCALGGTISSSNVTCNGANNGTASLNLSSAQLTVLYYWSNGNTTQNVDGLAPGLYTVQVTDANNCQASFSFTISEPPPLAANATASGETYLGAEDGTAIAQPTGGVPGYTFLWVNADNPADRIDSLIPGTYTVIVTDNNACTALQFVTVDSFNCALTATISSGNVTCHGANNGTATVNLSGTYQSTTTLWSNGETNASINGLFASAYTVTVTADNGCTVSQSVTITEPPVLSVNVSSTGVTSNIENDGTIEVFPTGGTPGYIFLWSNGETTASIDSLGPGTFTVIVTDFNGCTALTTSTIDTFICNMTASISSDNVTCHGANNGTAAVNLSGTYQNTTTLWSNGETNTSINRLFASVYTVTVTADNGCTASQSITITEPPMLSFSISSGSVSCFGGNDGTASLSNGPLGEPIWSNGDIKAIITGLTAGIYTVTVTDFTTGCTISQSVTITEPPLLSVSITNIVNVNCPEATTGSAEITTTGGTQPYSFSWPGGNMENLGVGTYTASVTDANNCFTTTSFAISFVDNDGPAMICPADIQLCGTSVLEYSVASVWDNCGLAGMPTVISGPPSGALFMPGTTIIVYEATDVSGNSATCSFSIVAHALPVVSLDATSHDHYDQGTGSIFVRVNGAGSYSFAWYKDGQPFTTSEDLWGLYAGTYILVVTDAYGCTTELSPVFIDNITPTIEPEAGGSVRLWPNPAQSAIQLEVIDLDVIGVSIVDLRGRLVQEIQPSDLSGRINIQSLPSGMYCLKISAANGRVLSLKFIKTGY